MRLSACWRSSDRWHCWRSTGEWWRCQWSPVYGGLPPLLPRDRPFPPTFPKENTVLFWCVPMCNTNFFKLARSSGSIRVLQNTELSVTCLYLPHGNTGRPAEAYVNDRTRPNLVLTLTGYCDVTDLHTEWYRMIARVRSSGKMTSLLPYMVKVGWKPRGIPGNSLDRRSEIPIRGWHCHLEESKPNRSVCGTRVGSLTRPRYSGLKYG